MNLTDRKNKIALRILNTQDDGLLNRIEQLIEEEIVGYDANGSPITANAYLEEMEKMDQEIENGSLKTYTTEEVRKKILGH